MKKGFTLIELLVVVLIMGILASVAMPQYYKSVEKSRSAEAVEALSAFASAEERHYMKAGTYYGGYVAFGPATVDIDFDKMQYFSVIDGGYRDLYLQRKQAAGGGLGRYVMYILLPDPPGSGKRTWGCVPQPRNTSVTCNDFLPHGGNVVIQ